MLTHLTINSGPSEQFMHGRDHTMLQLFILAFLVCCVNAAVAAEAVRPFTQGSLGQVVAARQGKPFVLVLWSLDCQYCPTELKTLSELRRSHPNLDVVLVATDTMSDAPQLALKAAAHGMGQVEQWVFADDMPERLRREIDPRWYGEVPRTYFYDRKHQRDVKTGLVSKQFFEQWLASTAVARQTP
jgi:thiol-disulfide isomerase/thioredoxin